MTGPRGGLELAGGRHRRQDRRRHLNDDAVCDVRLSADGFGYSVTREEYNPESLAGSLPSSIGSDLYGGPATGQGNGTAPEGFRNRSPRRSGL